MTYEESRAAIEIFQPYSKKQFYIRLLVFGLPALYMLFLAPIASTGGRNFMFLLLITPVIIYYLRNRKFINGRKYASDMVLIIKTTLQDKSVSDSDETSLVIYGEILYRSAFIAEGSVSGFNKYYVCDKELDMDWLYPLTSLEWAAYQQLILVKQKHIYEAAAQYPEIDSDFWLNERKKAETFVETFYRLSDERWDKAETLALKNKTAKLTELHKLEDKAKKLNEIRKMKAGIE